ncbi:hypothetical protein C7S14_0558 [Burkholderia cepacia]|nr:hypothetical protein C7S14_0558 [Burkholderia cepacia]
MLRYGPPFFMPRDASVNHMTSPPFTAAGTLDPVYPLAQWPCGNF